MIKQFPDHVPRSPGIYFFRDHKGKPLYIGKAVNLRNRLRGHPMLEKAAAVDWQICGSEIEALILESRFIKKYQPPYNISLRDDKNYSYVVFTDEDFPKIFVAHRGGIGPFTSGTELRAALKMLRKLFPYCTCKQQHNRPCLNAHLNKCLGICCLKNKSQASNLKQISKAYNKNIKILNDVLSGKRKAFFRQFPNVFANARVIKEIAGREEALKKLMKLMQLKKLPARIEGYDISNIQGRYATGSMVVFENGYPNKSEYRKFKIQAPNIPNDILMLREMLDRRFRHDEWPKPDLLLIDGGKAQLNVAKQFFSPVLSIAKGRQEIFLTTLLKPIPLKKLATSLQRLVLHIDAEAHRFAIMYYRKLHQRTISGTLGRR